MIFIEQETVWSLQLEKIRGKAIPRVSHKRRSVEWNLVGVLLWGHCRYCQSQTAECFLSLSLIFLRSLADHNNQKISPFSLLVLSSSLSSLILLLLFSPHFQILHSFKHFSLPYLSPKTMAKAKPKILASLLILLNFFFAACAIQGHSYSLVMCLYMIHTYFPLFLLVFVLSPFFTIKILYCRTVFKNSLYV